MSQGQYITALYKAHAAREQARAHLIAFIENHPMSGRQKAILFGWGENNYNHRIKAISDSKLIEAVEILSRH
jgi:hypothetical protein